MKNSEEIRKEFLDFFKEKGHEIVPGAPIVPKDDPTLMFVNAGMNQFKDVFLGHGSRDFVRAADTQRCLRVSGKHNDLEEVGVDTYHHTLFEMLGNWSFGDYFKKEAISWAMELLVDKWGLDMDRLYATVHEGEEKWGLAPDDEAAEYWRTETKIDPSHIKYCSSDDNFWMMGDTGPCGPCSEIHIDLRTDEERAKVDGFDLVNADDPLVMEIWNLVFIQYNCKADGSLEPLKNKHVDTGMGFERTVAVLQGKSSTYDTDLFEPILQKIADLSPLEQITSYDSIDAEGEELEKLRIAMRVIADHIRTICFAIADGAVPSNEGRGYVIRRILRRAVRYGYDTLDLKKPFLHELYEPLVAKMGIQFPELVKSKDLILKVIESEEKSFLKTLVLGISYFESITPFISQLSEAKEGSDDKVKESLYSDSSAKDLLQKAHGESDDSFSSFASAAKDRKVSGDITFLLHDTYGFPVDLTQLMAREKNLDVDLARYAVLMDEQKDRARKHSAFSTGEEVSESDSSLEKLSETEFVGYQATTLDGAKILAIQEKKVGDKLVPMLVLDKTSFYAESGGQVGDTGSLEIAGHSYKVLNTTKKDGVFYHHLDKKPDSAEGTVSGEVDVRRRSEISKHHTSTHLLHAALRDALGDHVAQKGSLVTEDRLRFDFSHFEGLDQETLSSLERTVNEKIQENIVGHIEEDVDIEAAKEKGAMMLFGEKYGDKVRVVTFDPDYSVELCGGIHVRATGDIGLFRFVSESSIAAGVRRVEAVAGIAAYDSVVEQANTLSAIGAQFKSSDESVSNQVQKSVERNKELEKEIAQLKQKSALDNLDGFLSAAVEVDGVKVIKGRLDGADMDTLMSLGEALRNASNKEPAIGAVASKVDGKAILVAFSTDESVKQGLKAGSIVGSLAKIVGGGGGGRPTLATAGGKMPEKIDDALAALDGLVAEMKS